MVAPLAATSTTAAAIHVAILLGVSLEVPFCSAATVASARWGQRPLLQRSGGPHPTEEVARERLEEESPTPCLRDYTDRGCMPHCWSAFMQCVRNAPMQNVLTGLAELSAVPLRGDVAEAAADRTVADEGAGVDGLGAASPEARSISFMQSMKPLQTVEIPSAGHGAMFTLQSSPSFQLVDNAAMPSFKESDGFSMSVSQIGALTLMTGILGALAAGVFVVGCLFQVPQKPQKPLLPRSSTPKPSGLLRSRTLRPHGQEVCRWVESLPVLSSQEVKLALRPRGGYDCLLPQPQEVTVAIRVEGRVMALPEAELCAPLTGRSCVLFSTSVGEVRLDGVPAPPVAFCTRSTDFEVELCGGGSPMRLRVHGQDVALFDVVGGKQQEQVVLGNAPEHLQAFVRAHGAARTPGGAAVLEFTECLLAVGAVVTCVGELRRAPTGEVWLRPLQERSGAYELSSINDTHVEKVMVSDDPSLLECAQ